MGSSRKKETLEYMLKAIRFVAVLLPEEACRHDSRVRDLYSHMIGNVECVGRDDIYRLSEEIKGFGWRLVDNTYAPIVRAFGLTIVCGSHWISNIERYARLKLEGRRMVTGRKCPESMLDFETYASHWMWSMDGHHAFKESDLKAMARDVVMVRPHPSKCLRKGYRSYDVPIKGALHTNRLSRQAMRGIFGAAIGDIVESGAHRGKLAIIMIDEYSHVSYAIDGIDEMRTSITLVNEESAKDVHLWSADESLQYDEDGPVIGGKP